MAFLKLATIALLSASALALAAPKSIAADSGAMKACLARAQADRAAAIATGTPRAVADRIWAAAVKSCKKQYASVSSSIFVAQVEVPEGCRLVVGTDVFECPDRPQRLSRHVPDGRNGAPKGTAGGGSRLIALSIPRDRADEAPKTKGPKSVKFSIGLVG